MQGYFPFTLESQKFRLKNRMVWEDSEKRAVIWGDAIFALFEVSSADFLGLYKRL